jgi:hypothetical protein
MIHSCCGRPQRELPLVGHISQSGYPPVKAVESGIAPSVSAGSTSAIGKW